jgi:hypothetical protein
MTFEGKRVQTPLGAGIVVGKESFYGGNLQRALVQLDDPSRWAFGNQTTINPTGRKRPPMGVALLKTRKRKWQK